MLTSLLLTCDTLLRSSLRSPPSIFHSPEISNGITMGLFLRLSNRTAGAKVAPKGRGDGTILDPFSSIESYSRPFDIGLLLTNFPYIPNKPSIIRDIPTVHRATQVSHHASLAGKRFSRRQSEIKRHRKRLRIDISSFLHAPKTTDLQPQESMVPTLVPGTRGNPIYALRFKKRSPDNHKTSKRDELREKGFFSPEGLK